MYRKRSGKILVEVVERSAIIRCENENKTDEVMGGQFSWEREKNHNDARLDEWYWMNGIRAAPPMMPHFRGVESANGFAIFLASV